MATVIDALIVELGISTDKFVKGADEADKAFAKTKAAAADSAKAIDKAAADSGKAAAGQAAGIKKGADEIEGSLKKTREGAEHTGKEMEERGKQASRFFEQLRGQVLAFFAIFTAGKGIKDFIQDQITSNAALGRTAVLLDSNVEAISAWRGAARQMGGSEDGITGSMQNLVKEFQNFTLTGESSVIPYFRALGVSMSDASGKMRPVGDILLDLADKFKGMDPARAAAMGSAMGFDQGTINLLIQGKAAVQAMLEEQKRIGVVTAADAKAAQDLQRAWVGMEQSSASLGRGLVTILAPGIRFVADLLEKVGIFLKSHQDFLKAFAGTLAVIAVGLTVAFMPVLVPIVAVTAAVVALSAIVGLLYDDWVAWTEGSVNALGPLWKVVSEFGAFIKALFTGSASDIRATWGKLWTDIEGLFSGFVTKIEKVGPRIGVALINAFGSAMTWLTGRLNTIWNAITGHDLVKEPAPKGPKAPSGPAGSPANAPAPKAGTQQAMEYFMGQGWSMEQSAGIVANLVRESGLNPMAKGDHGAALGLGQWHPDRQAAFRKLFGHGVETSNTAEQLAFVNYELRTGTEKGAGKSLATASNASEAAQIVSRQYERPADREGEAARRSAIANQIYGASGAENGSQAAQSIRGAVRPVASAPLISGMAAAASIQHIQDNRATTQISQRNETRIGEINVNAPAAKDAEGVAAGIAPALKRHSLATQANYAAA